MTGDSEDGLVSAYFNLGIEPAPNSIFTIALGGYNNTSTQEDAHKTASNDPVPLGELPECYQKCIDKTAATLCGSGTSAS
jgi:hypothetical protein